MNDREDFSQHSVSTHEVGQICEGSLPSNQRAEQHKRSKEKDRRNCLSPMSQQKLEEQAIASKLMSTSPASTFPEPTPDGCKFCIPTEVNGNSHMDRQKQGAQPLH